MPPRGNKNHARKTAPINANSRSSTSDSHRNNHDDSEHVPRHRRRQSPPTTLALTPPIQLPTPLPEEHIHPGGTHGLALLDFADAPDAASLSRLIDFDTPTLPPEVLSFGVGAQEGREGRRMEGSLLDDQDEVEEGEEAYGAHQSRAYDDIHDEFSANHHVDGDASAIDDNAAGNGNGSGMLYHSPPYREARLPHSVDSPPPLPVLARYPRQQLTLNDGDEGGIGGHVRAPTFAGGSISANTPVSPSLSQSQQRYTNTSNTNTPSGSSTFDTLTRTIRGYAAPSAPRVSRPLSYASFSPPSSTSQPPSHGRTMSYGYASGYSVAERDGGRDADRARMTQEYERDYERANAEEGSYYGQGGHGGFEYGYPNSPPPPHPAALLHTAPQTHQHPQGQAGHGHGRYDAQAQARVPRAHQHHRYSSQPHDSAPTSPFSMPPPAPIPAGIPPTPAPLGHAPSSSTSSRLMGSVGSGLAQAIRRGAAAAGAAAGRGRGSIAGAGEREERERGERGVGGKMRRREEAVVWARWDVLNGRRVLLLAYPAGLQMYDTADLSALREIFNIDLGTQEWALMVGGAEGRGRIRVVHAAVLPDPVGAKEKEKDGMSGERPLLGMLLESADGDEREQEPQAVFVVYSLRTHQVVKMRPLPGLAFSFQANQNFIVIGTTTPPALHILSATTFHTLHTVTSAHLEPYGVPAFSRTSSTPAASAITNAISSTAQVTSVSLGLSVDTSGSGKHSSTSGTESGKASPDAPPDPPHPVFALHHRLLAYASPSPVSSPSLRPSSGASGNKSSRRLSSSSAGSLASNPASSSSLSSSPFGLGKLTTMTQADVGHAALKVGESVFSGMRFIGGMALEAAKNRVVGPEGRVGAFGSPGGGTGRTGIPVSGGQRAASGGPGTGGRFVSRSAPDGTAEEEALGERRYSNTSNLSVWDQRERAGGSNGSTPNSSNPHLTTIAPSTRPTAVNGHYVTVLDLAPLLSGQMGATPSKIDEFNVSSGKPVVDLSWAKDGTSVAAALKDGHMVRVFKVQPTPRILLQARAAALEAAAAAASGGAGVGMDELELRSEVGRTAAKVYDLYRGATSAVVDGLEWAKDGRWMAMGTRNRTIHVFAVNPYGGKPDVKSHVEGRVRNVDVIDPGMKTLTALVRLRGSKTSVEQNKAPLAFTFITPADVSSSPTLMFPFVPPPISHSPSFSPPTLRRGKNYQDLLVFDPADGVLSLRRLTIDKQVVKEQGISGGVAASVHALGVTSISLPGMGGAGKLSPSPSTRSGGTALPSGRLSPSVKMEEPVMELVGRDSLEATWDLKRGRDWAEIKTPVLPLAAKTDGVRRAGDWLAEGEISTCSNSTRVLPRSLYLTHQFSFHTLGEDYHALIRRYQFNISGMKIEVRKAVEISAYASGGGESAFVEGFSSPRDIRRASSSFDEPIASAISGSFDNSNLPNILPMYPNGVPGSKPKSFRTSIPIRTMTGIGDGVSEGIGRIRREMHKARSPQLVALPDSFSGSVPLEFDEEDEDFLVRDTLEVPSLGRDHGESSISRDTSREGASAESGSSLVTPENLSTHQLMDADVVGTMEEDLWDGWDRQDKLAVEEAEQFHDITAVGYVEDEKPQLAVISDQTPPAAKRKGRAKRRS